MNKNRKYAKEEKSKVSGESSLGEKGAANGSSGFSSSAAAGGSGNRDGKRGKAAGSGRKSGRPGANAGSGSARARSSSSSPYALTPQLAVDAGSLAFGRPLGAPIDLEREFDASALKPAGSTVIPATTSIPGIMVFDWMPTIGISTSTTSPVSLAGRKMYYFVRHMNSGHTNYDAVDLTNYIVSVDSALYMFAHFRRVYGLLNVYSPLNRYFAETAVRALGFDFNDLQLNVANLRYALNMFAAKFAALCMPAGLGYYRRHMALCDYLISDGQNAKAQTYAYRPDGYYVWTEGLTNEWYLRYTHAHDPNHTPLKYADIVNIMNSILEPILASEDFNIMSGDILKAYGPEAVIGMAQVPADYLTIPVYDETALEQIQNMTILTVAWGYGEKTDATTGCASFAVDFDIHQSATKDYLVYNPEILSEEVLTRRPLLNFEKDLPTPDDVLNATRLCVMPISIDVRPKKNSGADAKAIGAQAYRFDAVGSEIVTAANTWQLFYDADGTNQRAVTGRVMTSNPIDMYRNPTSGTVAPKEMTQNEIYAFAQSLTRASFFNHHPMQYSMCRSSATMNEDGVVKSVYFEPIGTISDVANYKALEVSDLYKLHETAVLSEFFK